MKILLKNSFVGPMNSAQDPLESTETCFSIKKKKNIEMQMHCVSVVPKRLLRVHLDTAEN